MGKIKSSTISAQNAISELVGVDTSDKQNQHISEFTADLIRNGKLQLDKSRNAHVIATFHDSCNPARAMGLLDEPRYILDNVVDKWYEMPENTIREKTFCCGSGTALNTDEIMELRMRAGLPRANAVKYVHEKHGVNTLSCVCARGGGRAQVANRCTTRDAAVDRKSVV